MTPTDTSSRPLRYLRISITDRCNFRCTCCMPREVSGHPPHQEFLARESLLSFEEIERFTRIATGLRVQKVRLTGGEPLLRNGATDDEIAADLTSVWAARDDRYSEIRSSRTTGLPRIEMSYIGG